MPHKQGFKKILLERYAQDANIEGIEIGCFNGEFCQYLLSEFPNMTLTTIEPYTRYGEILERNRNFISRLNIVPLKSDWACNVIQGEFDFVFIDGDHSYEQCHRDILNYLSFVKKGGIMAGHNYHKANNSAHPGVHIAVDELFGNKVGLAEDFIWYVQV